MTANAPIGVYDSGVGGLSVVAEIRPILPHEDIVYFADNAHLPYGKRPAAEIRQLAQEAARFLLSHGVKLIVVACNTASTAALATLRQSFAVPFVGMVPAIKPAALATQRGKVGVIATQATVEAEVFAELIEQFANGVEVYKQACGGLVELVEAGEIASPQTRALLRHYLDPMLAQGIDALVLGCTHYPFLRPLIEEMVGPQVQVIDSGAAVARRVRQVLEEGGLLAQRDRPGELDIFASGDQQGFETVARRLLEIISQRPLAIDQP